MTKKIVNILFIGMSSDPCGLETYTTNIFSNLQGKGFNFSFININNTPLAYHNLINKHDGKIYQDVIDKHGLIKYLTRYSIAKNFFKKHHSFDIVHINAMTINQLYWAKAALRCGVPHVIMQSHNSGAFHSSKIITFLSKMLGYYNRLYINHNHRIIKLAATSDSGKWMFGNNSHYDVVNIGMATELFKHDPKERAKLKRQLGLKRSDKVIIVAARMEKQKNFPKIIETFKMMHARDKHVHLVLIGSGSEENKIKSVIHSYNLDKFTHFIGEVSKDDVARYLNIGDVMLIPSLCEAIPFSIMEAQAAGVPVVASNAIPLDSNVTNRVKFLSLHDSNDKWAKDALTLLNDNRDLQSKIKMNQDVKNSKFSLSSFINHIKHVYLQIVNK